ncbi:MAG: long-chain-fatty-acid--CoA ligase [Deltaproteobacteria bacterium]|nr:long-chain-fatty-acid--CoA ligase [Deltaproteobacteria bacterium]
MEVPLLVDDFLRRAAQLYSGKTAVIDGAIRHTYGDLQRRTNQMSNALLEAGITKGDRVGILSPNSHFFLESFYATSQIGAVLVPLNYRLQSNDIEYILDHAGVICMLADRELAEEAPSLKSSLPKVKTWITACDEGRSVSGWQDWDQFIRDASVDRPPASGCDENDLVSINYTSGTTARPKGVMLTHRNCYINAYNLMAHLGVCHQDVELWTLPMFHCNGWGGVYALTGMGGTHVVLRTIDAKKIYELIEGEGVTFACMAPTVLRTILDYPDKDNHKIGQAVRFTVAGAPPPAAFIERLETELGFEFIQIYGLTETTPVLTVSRPDYTTEKSDWARRSRAGVAAIGVQVQVLDEHDQPVAKDSEQVGEFCARSNVVFKGYWEQPDQTDAAIRDGWFHTGDLAVWDEHENVHIVDRIKDVIISGGENISSPEIEDVLYQHPAVLECAVIGVPSEKWGETPLAIIVLRPGESTDEAGIIEFCRENLAHFKCPTKVELVPELPRTATGKLQKFRLRETYWGDKGRRVG